MCNPFTKQHIHLKTNEVVKFITLLREKVTSQITFKTGQIYHDSKILQYILPKADQNLGKTHRMGYEPKN